MKLSNMYWNKVVRLSLLSFLLLGLNQSSIGSMRHYYTYPRISQIQLERLQNSRNHTLTTGAIF